MMLLQRDRRGLFDYDDEAPLQHLHLDPHVSEELEEAYAAVQDEYWQPWQEEKKEDPSEVCSLYCCTFLVRRSVACSEEGARFVAFSSQLCVCSRFLIALVLCILSPAPVVVNLVYLFIQQLERVLCLFLSRRHD